MSEHHAEPVGGPLIFNRFTKFLVMFLGLWVLILAYRFATGIGTVSGLTDGYPWGIWIAFDVVTGTALACGGYAIAILAYILNKGKYHPLVRPALLTSALGYSMAARGDHHRRRSLVGHLADPAGRVPRCRASTTGTRHCSRWRCASWPMSACSGSNSDLRSSRNGRPHRRSSGLVKFAEAGLKFYDKALIWIIALGVLLPTMHQSSLGTLMLISRTASCTACGAPAGSRSSSSSPASAWGMRWWCGNRRCRAGSSNASARTAC